MKAYNDITNEVVRTLCLIKLFSLVNIIYIYTCLWFRFAELIIYYEQAYIYPLHMWIKGL